MELWEEGGDQMDLQLKGKKAIVTGGSAGIGLAVARVLAEEGVEVSIPGRSQKKLDRAIESLHGLVHGVETDLGMAEGAKRLIEQVPETDILVNNLGVYESNNFVDITDDDWLRFFEINLLGGIRLARHYFPGMLRRNWGRVILVSSEAGETHPDMIHYGVAKTGQVVVARGLAEMTKGTRVTVNTILPGPTRSEANDVFVQNMASTPNATFEQAENEFFEKHRPTSLLRRLADESEVASLVAYLASPLAAAINGAAIRCEGGILRTLF
jgi:NAD(P)-dependent dehydrogenase (short-subunit alcohol dehydrogenase family)